MDHWSQPGGQEPDRGQAPPPAHSSPGPVPPPYPPSSPGPVPPLYPPAGGAPPAYQPAPFPHPSYQPPPPLTGFPAPDGWPAPAPPFSGPRRRRGWPGVLALVLVLLLGAGFGLQTWQLLEISAQLDRADQRLADLTQGQAYGGERLDALEDRAAELERQAGEAFNSEEVAAAVVPSVFMVVAGDFTGTAFAVGPATDGGGTNLFTNYHVVEPVWDSGGREVVLERTNQRYPAEIVDVDEDVDVAWLRTETSFRGLPASTEQVRSGQPIIAVGAPLGLTDVVTTGVVSSPSQELPDGSGPWIQFDAAVNPGNSGGPVINSDQEVVGIATRKGNDAEALGFAVPIEIACDLFDIC